MPAQSHQAATSSADAARLVRWASYASVATAITLIVLKAIAWHLSGSVALLSSLVDSLIDSFASLLVLVAVRVAQEPADREHRFGHGKAEALAALAQGAFVTASALLLLIQVGERLYAPQPVAAGDFAMGVMAISIVLTGLLFAFQSHVIRRTGSVAIKADSLHYLGDLLANAAVIVAIFLTSHFGWLYADPVFGLLISLLLLKSAWTLGRETLDMLMDRELSEDILARVREIALRQEEVLGLHDLRSRQSGATYFFQLHLELPAELSLVEAHRIADRVEHDIIAAFNGAEVIVHQDPVLPNGSLAVATEKQD